MSIFRSGDNCAQAVLTTFTKELDVDTESASNLVIGFGAGMGRLQETRGAVTGAYMVLGLINTQKHTSDKAKVEAIEMIQVLKRKFKNAHGATDCKSLLRCDLKTEVG